MKTILIILLFLSSVTTSSSQDVAHVTFDAVGEMKWMSFNDHGFSDQKFCKKQPLLSGQITDVTFDVEGRVTDFDLSYKVRKKLKKWSFGFPEEIYEILKPAETKKLPTLFQNGRTVTLTFYTCGEKATFDIINEIKRMN